MKTIPRIPEKVRRVNVAVDWDIWERANRMKINIHEFFRWKLQEAVESLEAHTNDPRTADGTTEAFHDSMACISNASGNRTGHHYGEISERVKEAAQRARLRD